MRLRVEHTTTYRYSVPMRLVVQSHRLTPSRFAGQVTVDWSVSVAGGHFGPAFTDGAGDIVTTMSLTGPVDSVDVSVSGTVDTRDLAGVLKGYRESIAPGVYLRGSTPTRADKALAALASKAVAGIAPEATLDRAHALAASVADAIAYAPGETNAHTTAAEALSIGKGVCQDHAHALIAVALATGIPARYVSGYLHAALDGSLHEASHAWAELHVEKLGWAKGSLFS